MAAITLCSAHQTDVTIISNIFIDTYMPSANGDYVKVYLYLLRCSHNYNGNLSISFLADQLENTEKDIIRALNYWEKVQLLTLVKSDNNDILEIHLNGPLLPEQSMLEAQQTVAATIIPPVTDEINNSYNTPPLRTEYSKDQITVLTNNEEVKWIMNIIEIYLERLLKPQDIQLILYLYDTVGFSAELIMYLYEYCVSKNKKNASYIEAVALAWAEEGIDTVEKAETNSVVYNSNYNAINKAFGLNRTPGSIEKQYMEKWLSKYSFSIEIIIEACNRTLLNTGKPDFKYADKILENWKKKDVKNLNDIAALDSARGTVKKPHIQKPQSGPAKSNSNQFNAFPQRTYSAEDYSSLEKRLLNK